MIGNIAAGLYGVGVTPVASSYESIATSTVGAGGATSIDFTTISGSYKHLQLRGIARTNRSSATQDWYEITFNSDTGSNYSSHDLAGDGGSAFAGSVVSGSYIELNKAATSTSGTSVFSAIVIDILDYGSTAKYKTVRSLGGLDMNGSGTIAFDSGSWRSLNAITSISINAGNGTGFLQYSSFALYGIKD